MRLLLSALLVATLAGPASATTLKIATLAPEGSSWMRLFHGWGNKILTRTSGRVRIKFYAGGVEGDERDVLRKMRLGQLSGSAVTSIGLGSITPEARALEIAHTYDELDYLRAALDSTLRQKFADKGFILLSWGDVGPIRLFSNRPVRSMADMRALKLWQWSDDPVSRHMLEALGLRGVPLGVPDVLPALSTGTIDAFFASPLSALALQWSSHAKYITSMVMGQATGACILAKSAWDRLSPPDQQVVREESSAMQTQVLAQLRGDNAHALATMQSRGMVVVPTPSALRVELEKRSRSVAESEGANLSKDFQQKVQQLVEQYRKSHPLKAAN